MTRDCTSEFYLSSLFFCDKVVNISPISWLQDPLGKYNKTSQYNKYKCSISSKLKDVELISAGAANNIFNAAFGSNLAIYVCNNGGFDYDILIDPVTKRVTEYIIEHKVTLDVNQKK